MCAWWYGGILIGYYTLILSVTGPFLAYTSYNNRNKWGEPKLFSKYLVLTIRYMCFFHYSVVLQAQNLGPLCWKIKILNALWFVPGVDQNIVCVLLAVLSSCCFPFLFSFTQSSSNTRSDVSPENQIFLHTGPWLNVLYHLAVRWSKIVYFTHAPTHQMCMCTHTHIETGIINLFLDHIVQVPSADLVPMHFSFHDYEINMTYNLYTTIAADNTHLEKHLSCNFLSQCVCVGGGGGCACITKCLLWLGKPALLCHDMYAVLNLNRSICVIVPLLPSHTNQCSTNLALMISAESLWCI